jgi:hypothetical protein
VAHDIFISYSSHDKTAADAVCAVLESRGLRCWIAPRDVRPGTPYGEAILDAITAARVMVLVLSSHANESGHIPKEVERAVSKGLTIIPVRIENVLPGRSLDYFIGSVHWLDAMTPPLERHLDGLAATIHAMLSSGQVSAPPARDIEPPQPPLPPVPQATATPPTPIPTPGSKRLLIGGAAVLLLLILWVFWPKAERDDRFTVGPPVTEEQSPAAPESAPPLAGETTLPRAAPSGPGEKAATIAGCWQWFNGGTVVLSPDGSAQGGPFSGRWRQGRDARSYSITWPPAIDQVRLSPDGRTLSGSNQYGFQMGATRISGGQGLTGTWTWFNGAVVTVRGDGTVMAGPFVARWQPADRTGYAFRIVWPPAVDSLTLSSDGRRLSGGNQYGIKISGTRAAC